MTQQSPVYYGDVPGGSPRSSPLLIAAAWLVVGLPLLWGVSQTFIQSLALFRSPPAQVQGR